MKNAKYNIGTRLGFGFAVLLSMTLALAVIGITSLGTVEERLEGIVQGNMQRMESLRRMSESVHIVARVSRTMALLDDDAAKEHESVKIAKARERYDAALNAFSGNATSAADKAFVASMTALQAKVRPLNNQVISLVRENKQAEATTLLIARAAPATQDWQDALATQIEAQQKTVTDAAAAAGASYERARSLMLGLSALALAIGAVLAWRVTRSITVPINAAVRVAQTVAAGDLSSTIDGHEGDETGRLMLALKDMNDNLANIVGQVRGGTGSIATASAEIASGNLDLSSRTEQQASSLEETASSMEEMTSTTRQNAENARQANVLAASASAVAHKGGAVVAQVVDTMRDINAASRKIVDIISVIDGIAFQTNILALNAAVEAARAGEQGRGFAVVASEVRNLAQRSAAAAKEIKVLIGDSVEKVDFGAKLVGEAGNTMTEIVASVQRVTDIMSEISAASAEQEAGIDQINQAIGEMDTVTQQNAALVEEAAAAAEALQEQSAGLATLVGVFKLAGPAAPGPGASQSASPGASHSASHSAPPGASHGATARSARVVTLHPVRRAAPARPLRVANGRADDANWEQF
ncbi:methyl-accepting chemotaxis protein [Massilia aquatica]|uniref:HAMP domain-containing protein n=1 Tax=Massilia aquatica TaxID=2609000 RepID=A0ABX0LWC6_9BURK|nr:methyl-accepting chemotaxis protein [Massilia aquatica]NHZ39116.1 HAMP domain-containing protein [Massilia aquatica]